MKAVLKRCNFQVAVAEESGNIVALRLVCSIWNEPGLENDRAEALAAFPRFRNAWRNYASSLRQCVNFTSMADDPVQVGTTRVSTLRLSNDVAKRLSHAKVNLEAEVLSVCRTFLNVTVECL